MTRTLTSTMLVIAAAAFPSGARAQATIYTDEAAFLADLGALTPSTVWEGFEDDLVWGDVRSSVVGGFHTAPSIESFGITWTPNTGTSGVTTGSGAARTGQWGFYEYPHGDPQAGVRDGFVMTGVTPLYGAGGWFRTNTPGARLRFILDGVSMANDEPLASAHVFIGVIDPTSFTMMEVEETESVDELYYVFADDFTFGFVPPDAVPDPAPGVGSVGAAHPNPFLGTTAIPFGLRRSSRVAATIFDGTGRLVRRLLSGEVRSAGSHVVTWDGRDETGRSSAPGVYWYRLAADGWMASGAVTRLH